MMAALLDEAYGQAVLPYDVLRADPCPLSHGCGCVIACVLKGDGGYTVARVFRPEEGFWDVLAWAQKARWEDRHDA